MKTEDDEVDSETLLKIAELARHLRAALDNESRRCRNIGIGLAMAGAAAVERDAVVRFADAEADMHHAKYMLTGLSTDDVSAEVAGNMWDAFVSGRHHETGGEHG